MAIETAFVRPHCHLHKRPQNCPLLRKRSAGASTGSHMTRRSCMCRQAGRSVLQPRRALAGSPLQHRSSAVARPARRVVAAVAATQRLKARPAKGTQRLARPSAKPAKPPTKTGTQRIGGTTPVQKQAKKAFVPVKRHFIPQACCSLNPRSMPWQEHFSQAAAILLLAIATGSKEGVFRAKKDGAAAPRLLARIEQLRLLSRLEELKLLSLLQANGITLTFIEKSGLIQTAENLGLLSAASDRNTPGVLFALALALYAVAPAAVYFIPDDSTPLIVAQVLAVAVGALGGTAAYAGGSVLSALQKEF